MPKTIHVTIYCDESKNRRINPTTVSNPQNWNYIGICIVPTEKIDNISKRLNNMRCGDNKNFLECNDGCKYHKDNKRKIHYTESQNGYIFNTAKKWTKYILDNYNDRDLYINILGIDYVKLDKTYFKKGTEKTNLEENIYCRFFRTSILYGIKKLLSEYDCVIVDDIIHDIGEMEYHKYFKKQVINYANWHENRIIMNCKEIVFISTTNDNCLDSNTTFLQLIDLFLGETISLIHGDVCNEKKKELSLMLFPIVDHCLNRPNNQNSKYSRLYSISFFPKNKINENMDELDIKLKRFDNFYNKREINLCKNGEQLSFFS